MRGGGGGEGELGTISSELVLWVSTAADIRKKRTRYLEMMTKRRISIGFSNQSSPTG